MGRLTEAQKRKFRRTVGVPYVLSDEQVEYIVAQFQYAPTEPGAPLTDEEWEEIRHGFCGTSPHARKVLEEVLARVTGLETEMIQAFNNADPHRLPVLIDQSGIRRMAAAARVIVDAVLGVVRAKLSLENKWHIAFIDKFCEEVRFRVEAKPKTLEGRVTVEEGGTSAIPIWIVKRDGVTVLHMRKDLYVHEDAEIYRLGLIAQLNQEEKGAKN